VVVSKTRALRVAERIRDELSEMLVMEISDPRLAGVSVTDVSVDRELAYAEVYVSALEGSERAREILEGLEHASGYLRHELSQRIELFIFPRLRFHWDPTFEKADRIERLLASIQSEEAAAVQSDEAEQPDEGTDG
jgi:ribosome-binding factor A